ncbi:MAG: ATP synthase F1 subunit gamma [Phycisphaerales bacterium]|nr:MAG: ATP synthase F1 subunit gamma [Phycisphaerales bacterium]
MAKTREIKKRIKAVGNIRRITKTMQMIATAKFAASQQRSTAGKPYTETLFELVTELARAIEGVSHPLLGGSKSSAEAKPLTLIVTSDRGLCGPYNGSVLRTAMGHLKANPASKTGIIEVVGKKGMGFLRFAGVEVTRQHSQFGDKPKFEDVQDLAQVYIDKFVRGEVSSVHVVYMKYVSAGKQSPTVMQLLPFQAETAGSAKSASSASSGATSSGAASIYEFSPDAESLLNDLLPAAVKAVLFQSFNDAIVSENVARMVAMKSATDNAGKMGKRLTRVYNRARQAQITTELTEIISGAAALE